MPDAPRKVPSHCPHCGFVQQEPPQLISTYCRGCGSHYKVGGASAPPVAKAAPSVIGRAVRRMTERPPREVVCHHCRRVHSVSGHARSTICPGCNQSIQLENVTFSSHASRPVNTRGKLTVESGASLTSARIVCGSGLIRGKVNGVLFCEGELRLACQENFAGAITARSLIIEKNSRIELAQPVRVVDLLVQGRARGDFTCTGRVRIAKHGRLEGRLAAHAVVVDRGGALWAESSIRPPQEGEAEMPVAPEFPSSGAMPSPLPVY